MSYYAVGFGSWHASGPGFHLDGQRAKVAGPFSNAKLAWKAANELQKGASMMCDFPFVFKGTNMSLATIAKKIDNEEYIVKVEYAGKHHVHQIRWKREYQEEILGKWHSNQPSSIMARRRLINRMNRR